MQKLKKESNLLTMPGNVFCKILIQRTRGDNEQNLGKGVRLYIRQGVCISNLCSLANYWKIYKCDNGSSLYIFWFTESVW